MENKTKYKVSILCPWHEITAGGFDTALDAYEYVAQMDDLTREDVISIKIERYQPAQILSDK
jgi:hypothetical protein